MRQDGFMRGREEFLASAITSAVGGAGGVVSDGGGSGGLRERGSMGTSITRVQVCACVVCVFPYRPIALALPVRC